MNDIQIESFLAVAEEKSFSKAAEKLYVSQPAVSKQIKMLEERWGLRLFTRKGRKIELSRAGEIMLDYVHKREALFREAILNAQHSEWSSFVEKYHIGLLECMKLNRFTDIISNYMYLEPRSYIEVEEAHFVTLTEGLNKGRYDMIITLESMIEANDELEVQRIQESHLSARLPKRSPLARKPNLTFSDLADQEFFMPLQGQNDPGLLKAKKACKEYGFQLTKIKPMANIRSAILSARLNGGVVLLDDFVSFETQNEFLSISLPDYNDQVIAVWKKKNKHTFPKYFLEHIRAE